MKTEDRITDFNLSEKLKSVGFPQKDQDKYDNDTGKRISDNGLYYWYKHDGLWKLGTYSKCSEHTHKCRALTTDELLGFLPQVIKFKCGFKYYLYVFKKDDIYLCSYVYHNKDNVHEHLTQYGADKKPANALAKLAIYMLEEGLIK